MLVVATTRVPQISVEELLRIRIQIRKVLGTIKKEKEINPDQDLNLVLEPLDLVHDRLLRDQDPNHVLALNRYHQGDLVQDPDLVLEIQHHHAVVQDQGLLEVQAHDQVPQIHEQCPGLALIHRLLTGKALPVPAQFQGLGLHHNHQAPPLAQLDPDQNLLKNLARTDEGKRSGDRVINVAYIFITFLTISL